MESKLDLELYNQSCKAFNQKDLKQALELLNKFKVANGLDDSSQLPFDKSFYDLLVNFEFGRVNRTIENINYVLVLASKLLQNKSLQKAEIIQINIILGECFLVLDNLDNALNAFSNVINLDIKQEHKTIWFKLLYLLSRHGGYAKKFEELANITLTWEVFRIPTHFILLDTAISSLNKKVADEQIQALKNDLALLDLEQQIRLFNACVNVSEYALAKEVLDNSRISKDNYIFYEPAVANLAFNNKEYEKTLSILNNIKQQVFEANPAYVLYLKGRAYDKTKDYSQAFSSFTEASKYKENDNIKVQQTNNIYIADYPLLYQNVDFQVLKNLHQTKSAETEIYSPTFLLGFPRSGTTLLDTVLDTQSTLTVLSERPTIFIVIKEMYKRFGKSYPQQLAELTSEEIQVLRQVYYDGVDKITSHSVDLGNHLIIDKMPLNTQHIPLILLLFPKAKFIFSVRHPLDCLISTWQQNLLFSTEFNAEMTFLSTLEKITKKYIDVLQHFERCDKYFDLNVHFIKYENLVENFKSEVESLLAFLDISNSSDDYLTFNAHAKTKIINTPSRDQVTEGIYKGSLYKWKHYEGYLEAEYQDLKYYIDKFNY
ncbi:sulfotransferase [Paraglaciecola sp. L3A3]|uniref:tetratricopeptide repeat-containing sulfotransferase family protein n=1 Tax=Paraglaciecola sp. L3A3 TaxID=2686358 RepID=UPI00131D8330|nr:sulfotransferase [Paraglaciecola sp. L3A3]